MDQMELSPPIQGVSDPSRTLAAIAATVARRIARAAHRRELSGLSDRQLRDAGIDLSMAGRGKAVAADAAMLHRIRGLSCADPRHGDERRRWLLRTFGA